MPINPTRGFLTLALVCMIPTASLVSGCASGSRRAQDARSLVPPEPPREFRAAWVATVANIDWPSKKGLPVEQQQREMIEILDRAVALRMNAIVLQVRTSADAFYPSDYEPWSEFLTGKQGQPPEPFYDPLAMWVEEAHGRGLELHAWFNPYRARTPGARTPNAPTHISQTNPGIVKSFGGYEWLDPSEPAAQDLTYNVFLDVVKRYDVDGIHIDDYFYPYPDYLTDKATGKVNDFPDDERWEEYVAGGGTLSRGDWRRENVSQLVKRIYQGIKRAKPHVQFGISPFGIARPGEPPTAKSGFSQYDKLYADAKRWLNEGWCDYYTPQLYWKVKSDQPYRDLLTWWSNENHKGRHLWPGLFTSRIGDGSAKSFAVQDILDQVHVTRETPGATGHVHFSMKALVRNAGGHRGWDPASPPTTAPATQPATGTGSPATAPGAADRVGIAEALVTGPYTNAALVPASPWLDRRPPGAPSFRVARHGDADDAPLKVSWKPRGGERARVWAVYAKHGAAWKLHVLPPDAREATLAADPVLGVPTAATVSAVDRSGNLSAPARAKMPRSKKPKK